MPRQENFSLLPWDIATLLPSKQKSTRVIKKQNADPDQMLTGIISVRFRDDGDPIWMVSHQRIILFTDFPVLQYIKL
jgi:hypothetical protein